MQDILSLVRRNIANLAPYSTARDEYSGGDVDVFLDANENPYNNGYNRYPDPRQKNLKQRISEIKKISPDKIFIGNGSDEAIDLVFRIFCNPGTDNAVSIAPTYGMYAVAAATNDIEMRQVQLRADFSLDIDAMLAACDERTKLMFVCSPNNPTGNAFPQSKIEELLQKFNGILVLDEAYVDFSSCGSMLPKLAKYPNLIVLQTLSKAWGLAGLRLGLAFADTRISALFAKVKYPYNINVVAQKIALEQLKTDNSQAVEEILMQRKIVETELLKCNVVQKIYPSDANFLLVKVENPRQIYEKLIAEKIIVRDRSKVRGCDGCLRITIGTPDENQRMIEVFKIK